MPQVSGNQKCEHRNVTEIWRTPNGTYSLDVRKLTDKVAIEYMCIDCGYTNPSLMFTRTPRQPKQDLTPDKLNRTLKAMQSIIDETGVE